MADAIVMPDLGSGMEEGTLLNWTKAVGDAISVGDVIAEIETDKATVEVPAAIGGTITQLIGEPGGILKVGAVIGYVGAAGESAPPAQNGAASASNSSSAQAQPTPTTGNADEAVTQMYQGGEVEAAKQSGSAGTTAPSAPTQNAPSRDAEQAQQGQVAAPAVSDANPQGALAQGGTQPAPASGGESGGQVAVLDEDGNLPDGVRASPIARKMAADKGIDLHAVHGSGPNGRIVKSDVEGYVPGAASAPDAVPAVNAPIPTPGGTETSPAQAAPAGSGDSRPGTGSTLPAPAYGKLPTGDDVEIIDTSRLRGRIAARMTESKQQVPHFYVTSDIDAEPMLTLRKTINENLDDAHKVSVNDLIVKACALALRQFPNLNTHFYGDKLVRYKRIHIGIAVAMPNGGLMNVVAKDADRTAISTIAALNKEMIARAREGKVKPDDVQGSTFTVSNLGGYDVDVFSAIINPPEAGILAVGSAKKVPIVLEDGTLGVGNRMKITGSFDHRVSDGAEGAQYMQALKKLLENPMLMLV